MKSDIINLQGKCYFKFCCFPRGPRLFIDKTKCIIGDKCKPRIVICGKGKGRFDYPVTYTSDEAKVQLAQAETIYSSVAQR